LGRASIKGKRAVMRGRVSAVWEGGGAVKVRIRCLGRSEGRRGRRGRSRGWSVICGRERKVRVEVRKKVMGIIHRERTKVREDGWVA